jgi:galactonate dehydratase
VKIERIETFVVEAGAACWTLLKLYTDEGVTGLGDCTLESKEHTVLGALQDLSSSVIGTDPLLIERRWQEMYRRAPWQGVALFTAMSALEQAMWDVAGQVYGQPVYRLLGGECRDRVRLYTWPQPTSDTPAGYAEGAQAAVAAGYGALKTDPFGDTFFTATPRQLVRAIERVAAMREAVGPDVDIAVDGHQRFYPQTAIAIARELEPLRILFFEEPVPSDNMDALAKVAAGVRVPLATGERIYTRWGFRPLLERQLVDVIQPDVCHVGGLWELRKIAAMAEPYDVPIAPHNPNGPVGMAAAAHVAFCTPNFLALESTHTRAWQWELVDPPLEIVDGHVRLPARPGLGMALNEAAVRRRAGQSRPMQFWKQVVVE